jgi:spore maturation protein CgeB
MKIAFFGSSLVSAYWNGAATYYRGVLRALNALGHDITFYEPDAYDRQAHRDIDDPDWARVVVYSAAGFEGVYQVLEEAETADLIVKASGVGVLDEFLEMSVVEIKRPGSMVLFWDVDAPATLDRVHTNPADPFAELIPRYDLILTYGGGAPVIDAYRELGARECVPIYNALDPSTHYPVAPDDRFKSSLSFLGNRLPDREARVDGFFFGAAVRLPEQRFLLGGSGWSGKPLPPNVSYAGHVYTTSHNAFNCSARAVLNVSRESMARCGYSPATRVFEAAGAAACIITDAWPGIEQFLEPDREVLVARNGEEVASLLASLSNQRARELRWKAQARVLAEHTYAHRASQVNALLAGRSQPRPKPGGTTPVAKADP